jgi:hypothetical protein
MTNLTTDSERMREILKLTHSDLATLTRKEKRKQMVKRKDSVKMMGFGLRKEKYSAIPTDSERMRD